MSIATSPAERSQLRQRILTEERHLLALINGITGTLIQGVPSWAILTELLACANLLESAALQLAAARLRIAAIDQEAA